ncbi:hypothetical protein Mkiyose1665_53820 [Mycobacterium kiyosense]|uniref:Luciferase-like domain-containing protein n=1 Tax=Mycobacterium kiyosense TaxID=2871094 RepID=A0A9P3QDN8_9MYCO|nr:hypothetical protein IWGMT90018_60680 [Mycobacterium kiyosense]BDE11239.1 hypothetical protein MKCMC460_00990 [Mycobacterium sp. 20KCMC460]GLB85786.1 hypothetical protein SRL2020028_50420 [Mycobacterium kiyosense]GLB92468.1 hypothetical protein SRL2020130_52850 [Mycobacterium kiyosense]GLB96845.1 hypothetical protein SRL2020226_36210 [Mycobacterium kiyosense]
MLLTVLRLLGVEFSRRGKLMDNLVEQMLAFWADIGTWTRPHQPLYVGGGSLATARRAARFGLPLGLADHLPEVAARYQLCAEGGTKPLVVMPRPVNRGMIYLHGTPTAPGPNSATTSGGRRSPTAPRRPPATIFRRAASNVRFPASNTDILGTFAL